MEKVARLFSFKTPKMVGIRPDSVLLTFILLIASFFRLYKIEAYMTFLGDEGRDMIAIYNILHGDLTLLGPASSVGGFFLGPIYYYFAAPFLFLANYNPVGPSVMVALFGIATVYLVYKLGKEFFSEKVGLAAAFLYAISPVAIVYSKSSWNPNIVPFFSVVTLYFLYKGKEKNNKILLFLSGLTFGVLMQLHYLATFIGAVMLLFIFFSSLSGVKEKIKSFKIFLKNSLIVFSGFFLGFLPFFVFELRHNFLNTKNIISFIFSSEETGLSLSLLSQVWHVLERAFPGLVFNYPLSSQYHVYSEEFLIVWFLLSIFLGLSSIAFFLFSIRKHLTSGKNLFFLLWLFVPLILFGLYRKDIYDYYLGIIFPLPFLLVGNLLYSLSAKKLGSLKIFAKLLGIFLLVVIVLLNIHRNPFSRGPNHQVNQARVTTSFVLSKTEGKPFNFGLVSGGNSDHAYRYFFKLAGREPVTILNPQQDPQRKTVTDQLLVVCEVADCHPLGNPAWEIAGFGRAEIEAEWKVIVLKVIKLKHYEGD